MSWENANNWEADWWGDCVNTFGEEIKQVFAYAPRLGLIRKPLPGNPYNFEAPAKRIVDIGGGPVSLLLKTTGFKTAAVIDPLPVPQWVKDRYTKANISFINGKAEVERTGIMFDEAWIYNCLQHTEDPRRIIENAQKMARVIRIFEWIYTSVNVGHPHSFTPRTLDEMLGGEGKTENLNEHGCKGWAYYGIFETR